VGIVEPAPGFLILLRFPDKYLRIIVPDHVVALVAVATSALAHSGYETGRTVLMDCGNMCTIRNSEKSNPELAVAWFG
jgi:hypothetical protein